MNPNTLEDREHGRAGCRAKVQEDMLFSGDDGVPNRLSLWTPEDIDGPEPWALASFSDLLPHEMA